MANAEIGSSIREYAWVAGAAATNANVRPHSMTPQSATCVGAVWLASLVSALVTGAAAAEDDAQKLADQVSPEPGQRQALDDAWWTGPLFAANAATLPQGHYSLEPALYDSISYGSYDDLGRKHALAGTNSVRSFSFLSYRVTDTLMAGLLPRSGYNELSDSGASGFGIADTTIRLQYRLAQYQQGGSIPALSFGLDETLPSGKYDELGARPGGSFGNGAYEATTSLYLQYYFWVRQNSSNAPQCGL
jgi:hypothetical protein